MPKNELIAEIQSLNKENRVIRFKLKKLIKAVEIVCDSGHPDDIDDLSVLLDSLYKNENDSFDQTQEKKRPVRN